MKKKRIYNLFDITVNCMFEARGDIIIPFCRNETLGECQSLSQTTLRWEL